jgi:hypothetical protein
MAEYQPTSRRPIAESQIRYAGLTVLDWTLLAIIAGCVETICVRLSVSWPAWSSASAANWAIWRLV